MSTIVGIIANPASGKDIRRLVAQAATISDQAKVSIVSQAIVGLGAVGVRRVLIMPDQQDIGPRAARRLHQPTTPAGLPEIEMLRLPVQGKAEDSTHAAQQMVAREVGSILILGGDGTARAVSLGAAQVPLLAVSTGTNNVLPYFIEGTVAGMAAGLVARDLVSGPQASYRAKQLRITVNSEPLDVALVDVALLAGRFVGSRAVWHGGGLQHIWVTRAERHYVGLTAIAATQGVVGPFDPWGQWTRLEATRSDGPLAVLGPGLIERVGIADSQRLWPNRPVEVVITEPAILALDGEREHTLRPGDRLTVTLELDGPWLIDPFRALRAWTGNTNDRGEA